MRLAAIALALLACRGESVNHITVEAPSCVRAICESNMSTVITETAGDADFATGITRPDNGEDPSVWSLILEQSQQQIADRTQALQKLGGLNGGLTRTISVPLGTPRQNSSTRFTEALAGGNYWYQSSVASAGLLQFTVPPLPVGAKITAVTARWGNSTTATLVGTTLPIIRLSKIGVAVGDTIVANVTSGTTIGSQSDTTAVLATYQALHDITLTLTETVSADSVYNVHFFGETGGGASTGGVLAKILITISLP